MHFLYFPLLEAMLPLVLSAYKKRALEIFLTTCTTFFLSRIPDTAKFHFAQIHLTRKKLLNVEYNVTCTYPALGCELVSDTEQFHGLIIVITYA